MKRQDPRHEFERFVADSADDLLRTGYLVVWDLAAAEDLVQECLFKVARRWPRVRNMEFPKAYARRILVNLALDGSQRRERHRAELGTAVGPDPSGEGEARADDALESVEIRAELADALATLTRRQRAVLVLRFFEDLSESQAAEALGCSVGTVKSTTWRALEHLRQTFDPPALAAPTCSRSTT